MVWYCTIEDIRDALEQKATAYDERRIGRVIDAASRDVDDVVQRTTGCFRPEIATRYLDWPPQQTTDYYRLWLDALPLISVTTLVSGGVTIASTDYFLEPQRYGPPFDRIEIDRSSSAAFSESGTSQRAVAVTGLWGMDNTTESAGTLSDGVDSSATAWTCSNGLAIGVGDHLIVGSERVIVTAKGWTDSSQNIAGALTASMADTSVSVADGSAYVPGEMLLVDAERLLVVDVAGNALVVKRAQDGSVLASHLSGVDVYARRALTVTRGAQGTTAASHSSAATIARHVVPGDVRELTVASAAASLLLGRSAYSKEGNTGASGSNVASQSAKSERIGAGIPDLRERVRANYGRQLRHRAV